MTELSGWAGLLPGSRRPRSADGSCPQRRYLVSGLRELADLLEVRTDLPVPAYGQVRLGVYAEGTDQQKLAQVDYASKLLDVPVTDETNDGGHCYTGVWFGPVGYEVTAIPDALRAPVFSPGQEVQLTAAEARNAARAGRAHAGVVVERVTAEGEFPYYKIRFPGWNGTMDVPASSLEPAEPLGPVHLSTGRVATIKAAETAIITAGTRIKLAELRGLPPADLDQNDMRQAASALGRVCGLSDAEIIRQLEPQTAARVREALDISPSGRRSSTPPTGPKRSARR